MFAVGTHGLRGTTRQRTGTRTLSRRSQSEPEERGEGHCRSPPSSVFPLECQSQTAERASVKGVQGCRPPVTSRRRECSPDRAGSSQLYVIPATPEGPMARCHCALLCRVVGNMQLRGVNGEADTFKRTARLRICVDRSRSSPRARVHECVLCAWQYRASWERVWARLARCPTADARAARSRSRMTRSPAACSHAATCMPAASHSGIGMAAP